MKLTLLSLLSLASALPSLPRQAAPGLAYQDFTTPTGILYRIAIPEGAVAPFDIALQIVAPASVQWAGIAWGGSMLNNPITVAWPDGEGVTASSRMAYGYELPSPYPDATLTLLPSTASNSTHWTLDALCTGCSQWSSGAVNPSGTANLAWAYGSQPVAAPSDPDSAFGYHADKSVVRFDFAAAQVAGFEDAVAAATAGGEDGGAPETPVGPEP